MKKRLTLLSLAFFTLSSLSFGNSLSDELIEDILFFINEDVELEQDRVKLNNKTLSIRTEKGNLKKNIAIHYISGICEFVSTEPEKWANTSFERIEIKNETNKQGYSIDITSRDCRYMIDRNLSDTEIHTIYFKNGLKKL